MDYLPLIVDHTDDHGRLLQKTFSGKEVPGIIKVAADISNAKPFAEDYGLVVTTPVGNQYRYPLVDAGNAVKSAIYFGEYGSSLPADLQKTASARISEALRKFGYEPPAELTKVASAGLAQQRLSDELAFAKLFGFDEDAQFEQLDGAFDGLSPRGKIRMAMTVKEASATVGRNFAPSMDIRRLHVSDEAELEINELEKLASGRPDVLAEAVYAFDVKHNITHMYGKRIPDPADSVFGNDLIKEAAPRPVAIDGREYSATDIADFATSGKDQLTESFGEEFYDQFAASPRDVLDSLPITHQQAIARMMDA